jgi:PPOX class probable FMN-dependent enzyme
VTLAPWRTSLSRAIHRNRSKKFSRYFQLATVTPEGTPANRTVVFRGFVDDTNQLKVVVDTRSNKIEQIHQQPQGEICWYFTQTREQFRLAGELTLVTADHRDPSLTRERQTTWEDLSAKARSQFVWSDPGEPRKADDPAFSKSPPDAKTPLSNFALLLLDPHTVDHLELRGNPQNRYLYYLDQASSWTVQAVNP